MCGIIGYTGKQKALPLLMQGLKTLEYRGYDSSGVALGGQNSLKVIKKQGKIEALEQAIPKVSASTFGIGHTRWATHGAVTDSNAHPHLSQNGKVAVCHNGIIDNYLELRKELLAKGYTFQSETDTEVIAQLIESYLEKGPQGAVLQTLHRLEGTYGLAIVFADFPGLVLGARNGSPMVLGVGDKEVFIASDPSAFIHRTRQVIYLQDKEMAILNPDGFETKNLRNESVERKTETLTWDASETRKGDYEHFFLKEVFEQPDSIARAFGNGGRFVPDFGNAKLGGLNMEPKDLFNVERVVFIGMGTALFAGHVGARLMENWARLPSDAVDASELRSGNPIVTKNTLYFVVSQSGETMDSIAAVQELKNRGARVLGIINAVGSSLARLCEGGVYIHAGPEISVASSKAFTGQITVMAQLALLFGRMRILSLSQGQRIIRDLQALPGQVRDALKLRSSIHELALTYKASKSLLVLGRGVLFPVALEGALKIKELSYVHAEGYASGNLKHGPLALIGPETPSIFLAAKGECLDRVIGNMAEVKARKGPIIAFTNTEDERIARLADHVILVPETSEELSSIMMALPLQLFAYYLAMELGRDVDRPRNLAKSVTTE